MMAKKLCMAVALALGASAVPAAAVPVTDCSSSSNRLGKGEMSTLLAPAGSYSTSNRFEVDAADNNHETLLTSGAVWDAKLGVGNPVDPASQVGTYSIGGNNGQGGGTITYRYPGASFTYDIAVTDTAQSHTAPGAFLFCNTSDRSIHNVTVHVGP
jgi:hypothetical protein